MKIPFTPTTLYSIRRFKSIRNNQRHETMHIAQVLEHAHDAFQSRFRCFRVELNRRLELSRRIEANLRIQLNLRISIYTKTYTILSKQKNNIYIYIYIHVYIYIYTYTCEEYIHIYIYICICINTYSGCF